MDILFSHVSIVTMDERMSVWVDAFLGVTDGRIAYIGKNAPEEKPERILDGAGMVLMPGLVNCHTHLPMSLLRGYGEELPLSEWLSRSIFPQEERMDARSVKAAALLSIAECLRFGVTSVSDMYFCSDAVAEAVAESGIKANLCHAVTTDRTDDFDPDTDPDFREAEALHDNGTAMTTAASGLTAASTRNTPRPIRRGRRSRNTRWKTASGCSCTCPRRSRNRRTARSAPG